MTQHMDKTRAEVLKQLSLINHFQLMQFKYHIQELFDWHGHCNAHFLLQRKISVQHSLRRIH